MSESSLGRWNQPVPGDCVDRDVVVAVDGYRRDHVGHGEAGPDDQEGFARTTGRGSCPRVFRVARRAHQCVQGRWRSRSRVTECQDHVVCREGAPVRRLEVKGAGILVAFDFGHVRTHPLELHFPLRGKLGVVQRCFEVLSVQCARQEVIRHRIGKAPPCECQEFRRVPRVCRHSARGNVQEVFVFAIGVRDPPRKTTRSFNQHHAGGPPLGEPQQIRGYGGATETTPDDGNRASWRVHRRSFLFLNRSSD